MKPVGQQFALLLCAVALHACAQCSRIVLARGASPGNAYRAELYSTDCGGATPSNLHVVLENQKTGSSREVFQVGELLFDVNIAWTAENTLRITIECSAVPGAECLPAPGRAWIVDKQRRWESVRIDYVLGERLASVAPAEMLEKFRR